MLPNTCHSIKAIWPDAEDGDYWMTLSDTVGTTATVPVYCHDMQGSSPRTYVTLPEGDGINYSIRYRWRDATPPDCTSIRLHIKASAIQDYYGCRV